jgi:hypothetical protein
MGLIQALKEPARDPQGVDQGPCLTYWSLSYRRRLVRDLWSIPIFVLMAIWLIYRHPSSWWWLLLVPVALGSTVYNYFQWQRLER